MEYASRQRVRNVLNYATLEKFTSKRNFKEPVEKIDLDSEDDSDEIGTENNTHSVIEQVSQIGAIEVDNETGGLDAPLVGDQNREHQNCFSRTHAKSVRVHVNWLPK